MGLKFYAKIIYYKIKMEMCVCVCVGISLDYYREAPVE